MYIEKEVKPEPFFIDYDGVYLHGDLLLKDADMPPALLFLHGAVSGGRQGLLLLRQILLAKHGVSSCAFDFAGYGSTAGELFLVDSCLDVQFAQASDVVDACFDCQPFGIVAADIHADVAVRLMADYPVHHLLLLNPPDGWDKFCGADCQVVTMPVSPGETLAFMNANATLLASIADSLYAALQDRGNRVLPKELVA